jgi:DNA polymerase (family 10)
MPVHNNDIAAVFEEIADLLEIEQANPFRIRAYRNAARTVQGLGEEVRDLIQEGFDLDQLPGIGEALAEKIAEIVRTGKCQALEKLRQEGGKGLVELLHIPGLGPKRVAILYHELDVQTPQQLLRAIKDGRLHQLRGFGEKTEQNILDMLQVHAEQERRFKLAAAAQYAQSLVAYLREANEIEEIVIAGSYRRCKETVGDLDILVTTNQPKPVVERFTRYDEVKEVLSEGTTRSSIILRNGLQVDLRVVKPESFVAALHYFTGSKQHNIAIRRRGQQRGLKINEYGVFKDEQLIAGKTEASVYKAVGLPYIPPELRENSGEIEAAETGRLPSLVELDDLTGDLHVHTMATDGHNTIEEMARAAQQLGFTYIAITEHSLKILETEQSGVKIFRRDRLSQSKAQRHHRAQGYRSGYPGRWQPRSAGSNPGPAGPGHRRHSQQIPPVTRQTDHAYPHGHGPPSFQHAGTPQRETAGATRTLRRGYGEDNPPGQ